MYKSFLCLTNVIPVTQVISHVDGESRQMFRFNTNPQEPSLLGTLVSTPNFIAVRLEVVEISC